MRSSLWTQTLAPRYSCLKEGDFPLNSCTAAVQHLSSLKWLITGLSIFLSFLPLSFCLLLCLSVTVKDIRETFPCRMKVQSCTWTLTGSFFFVTLVIDTCILLFTLDPTNPTGVVLKCCTGNLTASYFSPRLLWWTREWRGEPLRPQPPLWTPPLHLKTLSRTKWQRKRGEGK